MARIKKDILWATEQIRLVCAHLERFPIDLAMTGAIEGYCQKIDREYQELRKNG